MIVFLAETAPPPGVPTQAFDSMKVLLGLGNLDPFNPDDSIRFFNELYGKAANDPRDKELERLRRSLAFEAVDEQFNLIDANTFPIVVRWGDGSNRIAAYRRFPSRETRRALQPFTVQMRYYSMQPLRDAGTISSDDDMIKLYFVNEGWDRCYSEQYGLVEDGLSLEVNIV